MSHEIGTHQAPEQLILIKLNQVYGPGKISNLSPSFCTSGFFLAREFKKHSHMSKPIVKQLRVLVQ